MRGVAAFILVAVSSDGRLFNAIIRRSIVSQPFFHFLLLLLLLHPFDLLSTLGLVRHCFFSAVSIRGVYTSVPTDRYRNEKRSALRGRMEGKGEERKRVRLTILSLERGDSFPLAEFTRPGHRLTVKGITEIVFEIFLLLLFPFLVVSRFESVSVFLPVGLSTQLLIIVLSRVDNIVTFRKISRGNWRRSEGIAPSKDRYPRSQHPLRCSLPENYAHLGR